MHRLRFAAAVFATCLTSASAQGTWPERPVRVVVGATPGGSNDLVGRGIAQALARVTRQTVIVDNRPGVGSSIGADAVVKAAPDGYTLLVASPAAISVNPTLDPRWASASTLVPIAKLTGGPLVIVANSQIGVKSVRELVDYAKKNEGKTFYATSGLGTAPHLAAVLFNQVVGTQLQGVPYKGGADAVMSVMTGDTQLTFGTTPSVISHIKSGRLRGIAVTSPARSALVPDLPGMKEAGLPGFQMDFWCGLFAPSGTPPAIVKAIFEATSAAMKTDEFRTAMAGAGMEVSPLMTSPAEFADFLRTDNPFWAKLAKESGAKLE